MAMTDQQNHLQPHQKIQGPPPPPQQPQKEKCKWTIDLNINVGKEGCSAGITIHFGKNSRNEADTLHITEVKTEDYVMLLPTYTACKFDNLVEQIKNNDAEITMNLNLKIVFFFFKSFYKFVNNIICLAGFRNINFNIPFAF